MTDAPLFHEHSPLEKRRLRRVIREYRNNDYRVIEFPAGDDLPEFLFSVAPDAIAVGDNENVAIVVRNTHALSQDETLLALAQCISDQEDWRLELIVTNPKSISRGADQVQKSRLHRRDIYVRLAIARDLMHAGYLEAAFLQIWLSIVATLWDIAEREHFPMKRGDVKFLLKQLASLAIISDEEYYLLQQASEMQSCLGEGFRCEDLQGNLIRKLSDTTLKLLKT